MKLIALFMALFFTSFSSLSIAVNNVIVERRDIGEILGTYTLPMNVIGKGYLSKEIWRSPKNTVCQIALFEKKTNKVAGTFECESPEGFKAQVSLDCSVNVSNKSAQYLFFGKVGHSGEYSNFYVWCE